VRDGAAISSPVESVSSGEAAIQFFRAYYKREALPNERVLALLLNNQNQILGLARVAEGGIHGAALTPSDVLRPAIAAGARAVVLAHNHPSGNPEPSPEDILLTRNVREACEVVGVALLDHIVVAGSRATSMLEQGLL
jgi:DNA repair protein RadC